jgi:hypothetical protein
MAETIVFPDIPRPRWDPDHRCVVVPAVLGDREFRCLVSFEFLWERFRFQDFFDEERSIRVLEMNRPRLQEVAKAQILDGKVTPANEVLLTPESFAFKEVHFSNRVRENPYFFRLVRQVTAELEEDAGSSAGLAVVEWDRANDAQDRPSYLLRVKDFLSDVSAVFSPQDLEHPTNLRARLHRLWGELLQDRNHKQLQELMEVGRSEE